MALHPITVPDADAGLDTQIEIEGKNFGPRAAAYAIDMLCIWLISLGTGYVFRYMIGFVVVFLANLLGKTFYYDVELNTGAIDTIVGVAVGISYFALFEWLYGATPGKVLLAMRVVTTGGDNISIKQAFVRGVFRLFDGLFFAIPAITRMRKPLYQRYGDAQADTMVVSRSSLSANEAHPSWNFLIALVAYLLIVNLQYLFDLILRSSFV